MKNGGIKLSNPINKVKQSRGRKPKNAKNSKVILKDYMTHLAGSLAKPDDSLGLDKTDPTSGRDEMEEQLISKIQFILIFDILIYYFI